MDCWFDQCVQWVMGVCVLSLGARKIYIEHVCGAYVIVQYRLEDVVARIESNADTRIR